MTGGTIQFTFKQGGGLFGSHTVTVNAPFTAHGVTLSPTVSRRLDVQWLGLWNDLNKLLTDVQSNATLSTLEDDVKALARDVGVNL
jgi:hypothetical protein